MPTTAGLPTYFVSHGAGPWPYMEPGWMAGAHVGMQQALQALPTTLPQLPKAILMVSAHWEEVDFTVMASPQPPMLYDYGGFPEHTYRVTYPAPGTPELAQQTCDLIQSAGLSARIDSARGFDHGAFVPLSVMFPKADIPVFQLSLRTDLDPTAHLEAGRSLQPLRHEGVLILGSGMSYHNQRGRGPGVAVHSRQFDEWLFDALRSPAEERWGRLAAWASAPSARDAHPREEHFLPLLVALGAAWQEPAQLGFHETNYLGAAVLSDYQFGTT